MLLIIWRLPESPRWLEARGRTDQARKIVERLEARIMKRHPVLPEPDLKPYEVVAEEKTSMFAPFAKQYVFVTILLLVVMALGYGGIVYGNAGYAYLFLAESRGYSAGFVFALTAWAGVAGGIAYLFNALLGDRFERKWTQLFGAIVFAGGWYGIYNVHSTPAVVVLFMVQEIGVVLWLWSMYVYIPANFPTRMRGLGTGWTDGIGHLGAWGGVLLCGAVFTAAAPLGWILLDHDSVRAPARRPGRGLRGTPAPPRARRTGPVNRADRRWAAGRVGRRLFPEVSPAARRCHRRPSPRHSRPPAKEENDGKTRLAWPDQSPQASPPHRLRGRPGRARSTERELLEQPRHDCHRQRRRLTSRPRHGRHYFTPARTGPAPHQHRKEQATANHARLSRQLQRGP